MVAHASPIVDRWLGSADVHAAVHLHRIDRHDLGNH